jgi:hypothetical protein
VFGRERVREKNIFWVFEHHHREEYHTSTVVCWCFDDDDARIKTVSLIW